MTLKIKELSKVPKQRKGKYHKGDAPEPEPHEKSTIRFLLNFGFDIESIRPSNIPHSKSADFLISGAVWEMKSPNGTSRSTVERQFRKAGHQSSRMILDLRRINLPAQRAEEEAIKQFEKTRAIKKLMLITKSKKLLEIKK